MTAPALAILLVALLLAACQPTAGGPSSGAAAPAPAAASGSAPDAATPGAASQPPAAAPPLAVKIAHAALNPLVTPIWIAADLGFDRQYGLEMSVVQTRTAAVSQAALVAGEIDYAWTGLSPFLVARAGGSDVVFIGTTLNRAPSALVTRPGLTTPEALRGKVFGIQSFGGPPHVRTLQALARLGVDKDDVTILVTGDETVSVAALLDGKIDGAAMSYTGAAEPLARGYHSWDLVPLGVVEINGIVARSVQLQARPEETRRLLRAVATSLAYVSTIGVDAEARRRVGESVAGHLQTSPDNALVQLDLIKDILPLTMRIDPAEARELQTATAAVQPDVSQLRVDDWLDESFLDQLDHEGFFARPRP
jgi:ABC-type nitrate/sulfonate/bicarbonate transport system substrate-binding protein